ncbi:MAG TPA: class I SAM-dependent methyltransferase [Vicinamibacterales bacterium]|nr:class I SAM-dependent methyltransferase [Vicinamibacterales bacterium]
MDLLESWRRRKVLPHIRGRLLDIGCGFNNLVRSYDGPGVGIDVFPWPGVNVLVGAADRLPFDSGSFDTVTVIAALNHIPNRDAALRDMHRVLRPRGRVIVTMIGPLTGIIAHVLFTQDEAARGGMRDGERKGLRHHDVMTLLSSTGFVIRRVESFQFWLNRVYIAEKGA